MDVDGQMIFTCPTHQFVAVVRDGEMSCRGTPGHRVVGCADCDRVVADAMAVLGLGQEADRAE